MHRPPIAGYKDVQDSDGDLVGSRTKLCNDILGPAALWIENPYKLISLEDFMEAFKGYNLVVLGLLIDQATVIREARRDKMTEKWWETMFAALSRVRNDCTSFGLQVTVAAIERLEKRLHDGEKDIAIIQDDLIYIQKQVRRELDSCLFLYVPSDAAGYYENPQEGWQTILPKFPSIMLNVEEGSKCFALRRYTASVFHAMRILEIGLRTLANEFGVSADRQNWQNIIDRIESEITEKSKRLGGKWIDQRFYSEAALEFRYFKDAWRNHVMHARLDFDEERAQTTTNHVREFMRHLAAKLSENP